MSKSNSKSEIFRFKADEMNLKILGGTEKTHASNAELFVDAETLSRDPSYPPHEDAFVGNKIEWVIEPPLKGVSSKSLVLKVPANLLEEGKQYNFTVKVIRTKIPQMIDNQTASQVVKIVKRNSPELNIKCIRNCINPHPNQTTTLKVVCSKNCGDLTYKWTVQPNIDMNKTDFGDHFDKLLIEPNVFKPGDEVDFKVEIAKFDSAFGEPYSIYNMKFSESIIKGECSIYPKEGISGITVFNVSCKGFSSSSGIEMYMIYQKTKEGEEGVMLNEDMTLKENNILLSEGSPALVLVKIQDNAFMQAEVELSVEVKPFLTGLNNTSAINVIKTMILDGNSNSVLSYSAENRRNKIIQMISFLLDAINSTKDIDDSVKNHLNWHMAESLENIVLPGYLSANQLILILKKLQKLKLDTDTQTSRSISKSMERAVVGMHDTINYENLNYPTSHLQDFIENVLELCSNLLVKSEAVETTLENVVMAHDYDSYDDMAPENLKIRDDMRVVTENIIVSIQILCTTILHLNFPDQKASLFEKNLLTFVTRRVSFPTLANETINFPNVTESKVILPQSLIDELKNDYSFIDYQLGVFKQNPFWWHKNKTKLNTDFILFDLFQENSKVKTVKNPFQILIKTTAVPIGELTGTVTNLNYNGIAAHRIKLEPDATVVVIFEPSSEKYKIATSSCYCRLKDFSKAIEINSGASESERTIWARPEKKENVVYICVMKLGASKLDYKARFASFSCLFWNLKTGSWDSSGCKIKEADLKNESFIKCECSHLSMFTGQIFVPPNEINFNIEIDFYIAIVENWVMVIIVVFLLLLWAILLLWAWNRDRQLKKKNFICRLDDNVPGDKHVYLVVVLTGVFLDAGTTADVAFQIIGDKSVSRVHLIKCSGVKFLQRNTQDWFVIYTPQYLGQLKKIRIWHNCRGNKPHWYCERILIQDLKSGSQFCFLINKWFSLIWGDGKIYREINIKEEINLKYVKYLFYVKFETQLKDKHLWLSIFTRDAQSNFTCKERVSCAIAMLFMTMLSSAMFYGIPRKLPSDSIDSQSSFFISPRSVSILIESALITVPMGIIIVIIFRNSGSNPKTTKQKT